MPKYYYGTIINNIIRYIVLIRTNVYLAKHASRRKQIFPNYYLCFCFCFYVENIRKSTSITTFTPK